MSLRTVIKHLLTALGSQPWFRPLGMALVNGLNRRSFRLLKLTPGIHDVYIRGSLARGNFVPLASDIDLTLILTDAAGRSFEGVSTLHRSMRKVRRWNPGVRDWWQHMITQSELPVVEAFSELYGSHDWQDEAGRNTAPRSDWIDENLCRAAAWSQLCLWSGSAFQAFIHPSQRVHSFEAGIKKSFRFARAVGVEVPSFQLPNREAGLLAVYRAIEQSAARIMGDTNLANMAEPGIISTERALFVLLEDGLGDEELVKRLNDLSSKIKQTANVTFVLPVGALAVWPIPANSVFEDSPTCETPLSLAREIHLFEALYLPSLLRLTLSFPDAEHRLRRVLASLHRAQYLYAGDTSRAPVTETSALALFDQGSSLCEALQRSLLSYASERRAV